MDSHRGRRFNNPTSPTSANCSLIVVAASIFLCAACDKANTGNLESRAPQPKNRYEYVSAYAPTTHIGLAASGVGEFSVETKKNGKTSFDKVCTAIAISPRLVLTAGHCLKDEYGAPLLYSALGLTLGVTERSRKADYYDLEPVPVLKGDDRKPDDLTPNSVLKANGEIDTEATERNRDEILSYDFVLLRPKKGEIQGVHFVTAGTTPVPRDELKVIHHPDAEVLVITQADCTASDPPVSGFILHHTCDTDPGSSGAPIFNGDFKLVGIHLSRGRGRDPNSFNKGLLISRVIQLNEEAKIALESHAVIPPVPAEPVQTAQIRLQVDQGDTFVSRNNKWFLLPKGSSEASALPLTEQRWNDQAYLLWNQETDMLYEIPKKGGLARISKAGALTWERLGSVTAITN